MATNIAAIGYIGKQIENRRSLFLAGILYTVGRILAYTVLGVVLILVLRSGASLFGIQRFVANIGEVVLAPALILIGLYMLFGRRLNLPSFGFSGNGENLAKRGGLGALLLGVLFALAFCPSSGIFYFGMLIPMAATATMDYLLPVVFAVATSLPVLLVAWVLAFSAGQIGEVYGKIQVIQRWVNIIVALLFIVVGIYYCINLYL